uniref:Endoribonuclease Nob1 n=1 Tax=Ignisphaera aggregans TaxID=334771 RepID=A0A7C4BDZ3_9CREN
MQGSPHKKKALVLDTAAFLAALQLLMYGIELYTPRSVVEEVKDFESVQRFQLSESIGRVKIEDPKHSFVSKAVEVARRHGVLERLSKTDLDVLALALQLSYQGYDVVVLTDDYVLQKILIELGLGFRPVKTRGVEKKRSEE